jgi:hypothetical protein
LRLLNSRSHCRPMCQIVAMSVECNAISAH